MSWWSSLRLTNTVERGKAFTNTSRGHTLRSASSSSLMPAPAVSLLPSATNVFDRWGALAVSVADGFDVEHAANTNTTMSNSRLTCHPSHHGPADGRRAPRARFL